MDFAREFGSTVDDGYNVFQIMAHAEIRPATPLKSLHLCSDKVRRGDNAYYAIPDCDFLRVFESGRIPAVAEAQNGWIGRHEVQEQVSIYPPANWRAFGSGLAKTDSPKFRFQDSKSGVRCRLDDDINIKSWANRGRRRVGDQ